MTRLGDELDAERQRRELTQEGAALELGISQATFSRYVTGDPVPLNRAAAIARFLRKPLAEVRDMVIEPHSEPEPARATSPGKRSIEVRMAALEQSVAALHDELVELRRTPRRDGRRSPDESTHEER